MLGSLSVPIFAVVIIGVYTKYVPAIGAKIVMIGGVILYLISQFALAPYFVDEALTQAAANGVTDPKTLGILEAEAYPHFLHVMGILFVLNIIVMLVIGKLYPRETPYEAVATGEVDITPWKYATVAAIAITVLVLSTYLIF
jgi:SSS family solute:Na+ symporter